MTVQPRLPLTGVPHRTSADDPSAAAPARDAADDGAPSRRVAGPRLARSHIFESPFAFDLAVAVLCVVILCCATTLRSRAQTTGATASVPVAHQVRHAMPSLEPGETRSRDGGTSDDDDEDERE